MATPSYKERMKAARAEARAKREAEKAAWHRRAELIHEVRHIAREAVVADVRARGDRVSLYKPREITAQANALIGPWLVAQAKARIAARQNKNLEDLHKARSADSQRLSRANVTNEMES